MAAEWCEISAAEFTYKPKGRLVFAPEERDVYSYERYSMLLAPLGAKYQQMGR
jgi:hypothetical protein